MALHRAGFAWPPRHRGAGALLPHHFTFACTRLTCGRAIGRMFLWHFPAGFPGWALPTALALWCPDFPRGVFSPPAVARPAPRWYRSPAPGLRQLHRISCAAMPIAVVTGAGGGLGRAIALRPRQPRLPDPGHRPRRRCGGRAPRPRSAPAPAPPSSTSPTGRPAEPRRRPQLATARSTSGSTTPGCSSPGQSWEQDESDAPDDARRQRARHDERHRRRAGEDGARRPRPRDQRDLAGRAGRRAGRGQLLGQQARGDGLHPRHALRPASIGRLRACSSRPSARTASGRRCSKTSSTTQRRPARSPASC